MTEESKTVWKSVSVFDGAQRKFVLQQKHEIARTHGGYRVLLPKDEHRMKPITELTDET